MAAPDTDRVWDMMEKIGTCMLATRDGQRLRARPMAAHVKRDEHAIYFLTDARHHKDDEIAAFPGVCLAFADSDDNSYVAVSGEAEVLADRSLVKELWSVFAKAWWNGADDPNIRVLRVVPAEAEFWDSPGAVVSAVKMTAAVLGRRPDMGDNRKVTM